MGQEGGKCGAASVRSPNFLSKKLSKSLLKDFAARPVDRPCHQAIDTKSNPSPHGFRGHDIAVDLRPGGVWSLRDDLAAESDGTRVQFLQTGFPDAQPRIEHERGWPFALKIMSDALLGMHGIGTLWPSLPEKAALDGVRVT